MSFNEIYLDNSATTKCDEDVAAIMMKAYTQDYGNPSSVHQKGMDAEKYIRAALEEIAATLKCDRKEIIFTSGGTESDNLALIGAAYAQRRLGNRIITSCFEHPAILYTLKRLAAEGFDVVYLPVDEKGMISLEDLKNALTPDTILVSIMAVNNEIGTVQPLEEAGDLIKRLCPKAYFHTDAVQGYGKIPLNVKKAKLDLISISSHKLHGPKGMGFLYVKEGVKLIPQITGGGQQRDIRSGTENVPGIAGLGLASHNAYTNFDETVKRLYGLRNFFIEEITKKLDAVRINGIGITDNKGHIAEVSCCVCAPHIISLSVQGVRAEVLVHALEQKNIYVSSGSACSSNRPSTSGTLYAIGLPNDLLDSTVRISMSKYTTKEELENTVSALLEIVPKLRKYTVH